MNTRILWILVVINLLLTGFLGYCVWSGKAVESWVKANPQTIFDAVNEHLQGKGEAAEAKTIETVKQNHAFLYEDTRHPSIGNPDGKTTIVEFMDYNCGYCKKAYDVLTQVIADDPDLRVVLIEIPILHETSGLAARWALAANRLGNYTEFHKSLMHHKGPINEEVLSGFAKDAGLDAAKVKELAETQEIGATVAENLQKAQEIGINGTPGFIIGDQIVRGYIEAPAMKAAIAEMRKQQ